jgi:hypothetical protein
MAQGQRELAYAVWGGLKTLPAANGVGYLRARDPYSFASGVLLKSNMPATIAETAFISSSDEGPLLYAGRDDLTVILTTAADSTGTAQVDRRLPVHPLTQRKHEPGSSQPVNATEEVSKFSVNIEKIERDRYTGTGVVQGWKVEWTRIGSTTSRNLGF